MTDRRHTPGPWEAVKEAHGITYAVFGPGPHDIIAHLPEVLPPGRIAANARLIAAAPALLAAASRLVTLIDESDHWADLASGSALGAIVNEARAAVAAAE